MFEVGQEVWCLRNGKGTVDEICTGDVDYPVSVIFDNGNDESYTQKGMLISSDVNRFLYFSKPEIFAETEPPFKPKLKQHSAIVVVSKNGVSSIHTVDQETRTHIRVFNLDKPIEKKSVGSIFMLGENVYG